MKKYIYRVELNVDRNDKYEEISETFYGTLEKAINTTTALLGNKVVDCGSIKRELDAYGRVAVGSVCVDSKEYYFEYLVYSITKLRLA